MPKMVKGPDILLATVDLLRRELPGLFVLLSGPSRGFVRRGLERMNVPYRHEFPADPRAVAPLYHALDAYLVSSRQEGGPKAVLESMATGVPLVTTRVGQAGDLVRHGENGWMVDVEDAAGLARWIVHAVGGGSHLETVVAEGRRTAEGNSYELQLPAWAQFFDGFVDRAPA
jgi:glycosyltransferase involved in cell wall biosynthesis